MVRIFDRLAGLRLGAGTERLLVRLTWGQNREAEWFGCFIGADFGVSASNDGVYANISSEEVLHRTRSVINVFFEELDGSDGNCHWGCFSNFYPAYRTIRFV